MFSVSSLMSSSLLFDCSSMFPVSLFPQTRIRVSFSCECVNSIFFSSRNIFNEISGVTISNRRELIYFSESNRFHLLASVSTCSSLITSFAMLENKEESESNQCLKVEKLIFDSNCDCTCLLFFAIVGVSF